MCFLSLPWPFVVLQERSHVLFAGGCEEVLGVFIARFVVLYLVIIKPCGAKLSKDAL